MSSMISGTGAVQYLLQLEASLQRRSQVNPNSPTQQPAYQQPHDIIQLSSAAQASLGGDVDHDGDSR